MWRWMQRNLGSTESNTCTGDQKVSTHNSQGRGLNTTLSNKKQQVSNHLTRQRGGKSSEMKEKLNQVKVRENSVNSEQAAIIIQKNWRAYKARKMVSRLRRLVEEEAKTLSLTGKGGSHDLEALFAELEVAKALCDVERLERVSKRCAELQETLTQRTIAVDGIPHGQNDFVRQQRKDTVRTILSLAEKADSMKEQVESALDSIKNEGL